MLRMSPYGGVGAVEVERAGAHFQVSEAGPIARILVMRLPANRRWRGVTISRSVDLDALLVDCVAVLRDGYLQHALAHPRLDVLGVCPCR